jgi:hypothetical protein
MQGCPKNMDQANEFTYVQHIYKVRTNSKAVSYPALLETAFLFLLIGRNKCFG